MNRRLDSGARGATTRSPIFVAILILVPALILVISSPARAQFVKVEAGASDLLPSAGGAISLESAHYTSYISAGTIDGLFSSGVYMKTTIGSHVVTIGDQPISFDLPTDVFGTNHEFLMRGVGITTQEGNATIWAFAGTTALARGAQFFQAAKPGSPAGALFTDAHLTDKVRFYSRNIVSRQLTSIQGVDWNPRKWLRGGVSAGIGSGEPYFAVTTDLENRWLSLRTAYVSAGDRFRRLTEPSVFASEVGRENIVAVLKPYSGMLLTLGHQNYLQPQSSDSVAPFIRATVNQVQSTFDAAQFRFGAGLFQSSTQMRNNMAAAFSASRRVTQSVDMAVNYFHTLSGAGPSAANLSISIREALSPRLSLLQVVNDSNGRLNVLYGGSYLSNRFTLSVDYQTLYLPLGRTYFSQGINVGLHIRLGSLQMNLQTFRSADGRLRYTASADSLLTPKFRLVHTHDESTISAMRYIAHGYVQDDRGRPIEGAAIRVGSELIFSNSEGEFFVRFRKASNLPLGVVFEEFLNPAGFSLVSAPHAIAASPDDAGSEALIVLRRK